MKPQRRAYRLDFFTELAVTRVSVMARGQTRHVWLVTYRDRWFPWYGGAPFKSWRDVTAHWEDVEPGK